MNEKTSLKILIADDDQDDCLLFKDALQEIAPGASLIAVHDGEQLMQHLETLSDNLPDALFLDLNMPRKNGFECLTEIKANPAFSKIPIIIYTTASNEERANFLLKMGAHYYICKPSDFDELKKSIQRSILFVDQNPVRSTACQYVYSSL